MGFCGIFQDFPSKRVIFDPIWAKKGWFDPPDPPKPPENHCKRVLGGVDSGEKPKTGSKKSKFRDFGEILGFLRDFPSKRVIFDPIWAKKGQFDPPDPPKPLENHCKRVLGGVHSGEKPKTGSKKSKFRDFCEILGFASSVRPARCVLG